MRDGEIVSDLGTAYNKAVKRWLEAERTQSEDESTHISTQMRVFVSSPYRGDVERNKYMTDGYAHRVLEAGHIPFVPHTQYEWTLRFFPEAIAHILAMYFCCKEIEKSDEVWTFGEMSDGMRFECNYARGLNKPVKNGEVETRK